MTMMSFIAFSVLNTTLRVSLYIDVLVYGLKEHYKKKLILLKNRHSIFMLFLRELFLRLLN